MELIEIAKMSTSEIEELVAWYYDEKNSKKLKASTFKELIEVAHYCFEDFLEELTKCSACHNWIKDDELEDTEGRLNGGIGRVCEQCIEDLDIGRS